MKQAIQIRLADPRILMNEVFGYTSFTTGLLTALALTLGHTEIYNILNQVMLASCFAQNIPLLMVYLPQWRVLISTGILGIMIANYFATNPFGNAFREGLFVGMIKVDYSYEALHKYHPNEYPSESSLLGRGQFQKNIAGYLNTNWQEMLKRSREMLVEISKANFQVFVKDAIRSQYFSSLMRIISATPLFVVAGFELAAYSGYFQKNDVYTAIAAWAITISVRALALSSFVDGLSKIAFGFMRESFMMRVGGCIFALAQLYLVFMGETSLQLVIPLSLAGLAAYPIVEGERLRKLALDASIKK